MQRSCVQQPGVPYGATLAEATGSNPGAADYRYFGRDAHGSTRATFAQDKARTGTADWHPYGIQRQGFGLSSAQAFTGQWKSSYTGDYQFGLRTYSPGLARWLSRDSLGYVDGPNMHGYAKANPIAYVDAQGAMAFAPILGAAFLGGLFGGIKAAICGDPIWSGVVVGAGIAVAFSIVAGGVAYAAAKGGFVGGAALGEFIAGGGGGAIASAGINEGMLSFTFNAAVTSWTLAADEGIRMGASSAPCGSRRY